MDDLTLYIFLFIIYAGIAVLMGIITEKIAKQKGYTSGFLWGFLLGLLGLIVVECMPFNINVSNANVQKVNAFTKKDYTFLCIMSSIFMIWVSIYMYKNEDSIIKFLLLFIGTILIMIYFLYSYIIKRSTEKITYFFIIGFALQFVDYIIINYNIASYYIIAKIFIIYNILFSIILFLCATNKIQKSKLIISKAMCSISMIFSVIIILWLSLDGNGFFYEFEDILYLAIIHILQIAYLPYFCNLFDSEKKSKH